MDKQNVGGIIMVIFDFDNMEFPNSNSKPCIRIDIRDSTKIVEYPSITKAADDIVVSATNIKYCCNKNKGLKTPIYRVKDWYFIYKED